MRTISEQRKLLHPTSSHAIKRKILGAENLQFEQLKATHMLRLTIFPPEKHLHLIQELVLKIFSCGAIYTPEKQLSDFFKVVQNFLTGTTLGQEAFELLKKDYLGLTQRS